VCSAIAYSFLLFLNALLRLLAIRTAQSLAKAMRTGKANDKVIEAGKQLQEFSPDSLPTYQILSRARALRKPIAEWKVNMRRTKDWQPVFGLKQV